VRQLARRLGRDVPAPRVARAEVRKQEFRRWLFDKMGNMAALERRLYARARWARACLHFFPDHELAWAALAAHVHSERQFEIFWEAASNRIGRLGLYRSWRAAYASQ